MKEKFKSYGVRVSHCEPSDLFLRTRQNLSYTPAQMMKLAEKGVPVSQVNVDESQFYDGEVNPSWSVPIERDRGIDAADVWQAQQESRSKLRKAHRDDIRAHGMIPQSE
jgi:hypothetical protein